MLFFKKIYNIDLALQNPPLRNRPKQTLRLKLIMIHTVNVVMLTFSKRKRLVNLAK